MRPMRLPPWGLASLALVLLGSLGCFAETHWYNKGLRARSPEKKIEFLTKAIELKPEEYPLTYFYRANAYFSQKRYDLAVADYTKAIELEPGLAMAHYGRGRAYRAKGLYDPAIADFAKAIQIKWDYALAFYGRGNAYFGKGLYDLALVDYSKAIELKPDLPYVHYRRGLTHRAMELYDLAIADFNEAIRRDPDYAPAYLNLAWLLATSPDPHYRNGKRAVELATRAVKLDGNPGDLDTLAAAYAEAGRFEDAVRTQLRAIALRKEKGDKKAMADGQERLERYRLGKPWRMSAAGDR